MKNFSTLPLSLALLAFSASEPALPQAVEEPGYEQWVEYRDGEISVAFDQAPIEVALYVIRSRTGFEIILPPATENKLLNLRLSRLPLEPAVRSLLASIGYRNFIVMYDENGRPNRAVVLEARLDDRTSPSTEPAPQLLKEEEKDKLQKELERWNELKQEDRGRIEERLRTLPPSEERDQLIKEYGRQLLGIKK